MKSFPVYKMCFILIIGWLFNACNKDETKIIYKGGTAPVLTVSTDTLPLVAADSSNSLVTFFWTNPDYQFSDGVSSLDVAYAIQVDTLGANFSSIHMQSITPSPACNLSTTFTVGQLNAILGNGLLLKTNQSHKVQFRVMASLGSLQTQLVSNSFTYTVTPYAPPPKIAPPSSGVLFIVGNATPGGWPPLTVDASTQQFTQVSPTEYKITIALTGGLEYKFVEVVGAWDEQWSVKDQDTYPSGGPFVYNGANCIAPAASGTYVIDVNFQTGTFTVTKQ